LKAVLPGPALHRCTPTIWKREIMTETEQEKNEIETPMKETAARFSQPADKHAANRMANKLRKKRAHKRNLRRSHANG
jgi:hypothetical protein